MAFLLKNPRVNNNQHEKVYLCRLIGFSLLKIPLDPEKYVMKLIFKPSFKTLFFFNFRASGRRFLNYENQIFHNIDCITNPLGLYVKNISTRQHEKKMCNACVHFKKKINFYKSCYQRYLDFFLVCHPTTIGS